MCFRTIDPTFIGKEKNPMVGSRNEEVFNNVILL